MHAVAQWLDRNILELGREMRLSYLPPLMVYMAAGISGLTGIVGTFFVKDYLGLSAAVLAALGFWAGVPWALKMPLGHLVDLIWRWKSLLVFLGAAMTACASAGSSAGSTEAGPGMPFSATTRPDCLRRSAAQTRQVGGDRRAFLARERRRFGRTRALAGDRWGRRLHPAGLDP